MKKRISQKSALVIVLSPLMFVFANLAPKSVMNIRSVDKSDILNLFLFSSVCRFCIFRVSENFFISPIERGARGAPERERDEKQRVAAFDALCCLNVTF